MDEKLVPGPCDIEQEEAKPKAAATAAAGEALPLAETPAPDGENGAGPTEDAPTPARAKPRRRPVRGMEVLLLAVGLAILMLLITLATAAFSLAGGVSSLFSTGGSRTSPPAGSYSILSVEGTIQSGNSSGYQHSATVQYIKKMAEDEGNLGILLYMNTGGGGVYESDEVYRALMDYKEATGRPVWAYMSRTCASGGYYICAAADYIVANHNATTGSIGVYYQFTDLSGLYEKLGVETVLVRSGDNKGIGIEGAEITAENRAVYQSMVDEYYDRFVEIIMAGREGLNETQVRRLGDGRPYTALQALENGLVDELNDWETVKTAFDEETGGTGYTVSFATSSAFSRLLQGLQGLTPKSETESLLELAEGQVSGLMAEAGGLA